MADLTKFILGSKHVFGHRYMHMVLVIYMYNNHFTDILVKKIFLPIISSAIISLCDYYSILLLHVRLFLSVHDGDNFSFHV